MDELTNFVENDANNHDHSARTDHTRNAFSIPRAHTTELLCWQNKVYTAVDGGRTVNLDDGLHVCGQTVDAVAEALISLLRSHRLSTPFVPPEGVVCDRLPLRSFIQRWHRVRM